MKMYKKSNYIITAEKVEVGTKVYNFLEDCHYETSEEKCIVLTGTAGEQWVVTEDKLRNTYAPDGDRHGSISKMPAGPFRITPKPSADVIFAEQVTEKVQVETSWGEILTANRDGVPHGSGDYIVYAAKGWPLKPDSEDRWIVNGEIFPETYEEYVYDYRDQYDGLIR